MSVENKKAFVIFIAATGHINPTVCVCSELVKKGVDVSFYSVEKYRHLIERAGCRFIPYDHYPDVLLKQQSLQDKNYFMNFMTHFLTFTDREMPRLIADIDREKPDLIICDQVSVHARYLSDIVKLRYEKGLSSTKPPKMVEICSHFILRPGIFPSEEANNKAMSKNKDNWFYYIMLAVFVKQFWVSWKYSLSTIDPFSYMFDFADPRLAIVTIFPDLQPKRDVFEKMNYKFVGACLDESVRTPDILDARLKHVLDSFPAVNPLSSIEKRGESNKRLIYISLGTMYNDNDPIIQKIITAIKLYEARSDRYELTVLISLGEPLFKRYESTNVKLPDNFVIQPSVPQLEVLKRAALFVTHSGMNSSSEAIHFAVPVLSIPLLGEQPLNATRLTDELGFGKQFDFEKLDENEMSAAVEDILTDDAFLEKIMLYSKISRRYDGAKIACNEIIKYLGQ